MALTLLASHDPYPASLFSGWWVIRSHCLVMTGDRFRLIFEVACTYNNTAPHDSLGGNYGNPLRVMLILPLRETRFPYR